MAMEGLQFLELFLRATRVSANLNYFGSYTRFLNYKEVSLEHVGVQFDVSGLFCLFNNLNLYSDTPKQHPLRAKHPALGKKFSWPNLCITWPHLGIQISFELIFNGI